MKKRVLAIFLSVCLCSSLIGAFSAVGYAAGGAQGVVDAAKSYLENSVGPDFGGGESDWCGRFLYRCAEDAGESAALCGSVDTMKSTNGAMKWFVQNGCEGGYFYQGINYGNYGMSANHLRSKDAYSPALGDIIFYDWDGNPTNFGHMELVTGISGRTITTIGGSTGGSCKIKNWNGRYHVHAHTYDISNKFIVGYVRPNYGGTVTTLPLSINPTSEPGEHREVGSPFYFRGSITSSYNITSATVEILSGSTVVQTRTVTPNKTNVDILKDGLDSLKFGQLGEGAYILRLTATDSSGATEEWSKAFSVGNASVDPPPSELLLLPTHGPSEHHPQGSSLHFRGTASSNYLITTSSVQVRLDDNMTIIMEKVVTPNKYSIDALTDGLDSLKFEDLKEGNYNFWWLVSDASGTQKAWVAHFSVTTPAPVVTPTPTPTPTPEPDDLWDDGELEEPEPPAAWSTKLPTTFTSSRSWSSLTFDDVYSNTWYYDSVKLAYRYELMNGVGENQFQPEGNLTVAEAITLAARIHAKYYGNTISPIDSGAWYDGAVAYARRNGIPASAPYEVPATREAFARILSAALPEEELWSNGSSISFADANQLRYADAISLLCDAGILNGIPRNNGAVYFEPNNNVTRAQAAAIVTRMVIPDSRL